MREVNWIEKAEKVQLVLGRGIWGEIKSGSSKNRKGWEMIYEGSEAVISLDWMVECNLVKWILDGVRN